MTSLREKMAAYGFESNENYDYIVRCLQNSPDPIIRCLNIEGDGGRRKTAFANALAHALETEHILYHDFTQEEPVTQSAVVRITDDDEGKEEPPIVLFDRIMSDVCAFSEAEKTILILDQLHAADFKEHIRIYRFLTEREWRYGDAVFYANRKNLLVFLVSEEPLYHSLQKNSFKVWIAGPSGSRVPYRPADFKLDADAEPLLNALYQLFEKLSIFPTFSEYKKIIFDIQHNVHCADDLKASIYGWTEAMDNNRLMSEQTHAAILEVMPEVEAFIGIDEDLELTEKHVPGL
ncbi:MAG: hypothetical protein JXA04_02260 [Gammaproteobacteria bacterium]|nr:hypothetical protein [Gammaproteobacteria bacterium]